MSNPNKYRKSLAATGAALSLAVLTAGCEEGASTGGIGTKNKPVPEKQIYTGECGQLDALESIGNDEFRITGFLGNASCATLYQDPADIAGSRLRDLGIGDVVSNVCVLDSDLKSDGRGILNLGAHGLNANVGFVDASQRAVDVALTSGNGYCG